MRCQARKGHIDMNNNRRSCLRKIRTPLFQTVGPILILAIRVEINE